MYLFSLVMLLLFLFFYFFAYAAVMCSNANFNSIFVQGLIYALFVFQTKTCVTGNIGVREICPFFERTIIS